MCSMPSDTRKPPRGHAGGELFRRRELGVRRRGRMDDERLRVAHIREAGNQLQAVHENLPVN